MDSEKSLWWILQVQLPERNGDQLDLFSSPISRPDLIRKAFSIIPQSVRVKRGDSIWGIADLNKINNDLFFFKLTVRPPFTRIAEEPVPGHLKETKDPRFYTLSILNVPKQIIVVHRSPDVSKYARSAKTFASIYEELLEKAIESVEMKHHYNVEVEPIAKFGSFVEWVNSIDILKKIVIRHSGSNLPAGASDLIGSIRETAKKFKKALHSEDVELVANDPNLDNEEVEELDAASADRRLKMRARGVKAGVVTTWSSSDKPVPETAIVPLPDDKLDDAQLVARMIDRYIEEYFDKEKVKK